MCEYSFERIPDGSLAVIEQMVDVLKDVEGASERFLEETKDLMGRTNPPELLDSIGRECELLCNSAESLGRAIIGEILRSQCGHTILEEQRRRVSRSSASARNRAGKGVTRPDRGAVRVLAAELVV